MSESQRKLSNPLVLAVMVLLYERPMHPYEMAAALRERRKENSIKLRYGSIYTVIELSLYEPGPQNRRKRLAKENAPNGPSTKLLQQERPSFVIG